MRNKLFDIRLQGKTALDPVLVSLIFLGILYHVEFFCFSISSYAHLCLNSLDLLKTILSSAEAI
jgi:hypothetical protein